MKTLLLYLFFTFAIAINTMTQNQIAYTKLIGLNRNEFLITPTSAESRRLIYVEEAGQFNTLLITYLEISPFFGSGGSSFVFVHRHQKLEYGLLNNQINKSELINDEPNRIPKYGELIHDATTITIDENILSVENAYFFDESYYWLDEPLLYGEFSSITSDLFKARLSPNQLIVCGAVRHQLIAPRISSTGLNKYTWALWNSITGNVLFIENPNFDHIGRNFGLFANLAIEVQFSPDSRYFYIRRLFLSNFDVPTATLISTVTGFEWEADKDVTFTPDSRFFVTERNGEPTLVDTQHNRNLQVYDIGASIMHAATFSQDGETLYIATGDDKIYVFPSQLPTSHVEEWEVYE